MSTAHASPRKRFEPGFGAAETGEADADEGEAVDFLSWRRGRSSASLLLIEEPSASFSDDDDEAADMPEQAAIPATPTTRRQSPMIARGRDFITQCSWLSQMGFPRTPQMKETTQMIPDHVPCPTDTPMNLGRERFPWREEGEEEERGEEERGRVRNSNSTASSSKQLSLSLPPLSFPFDSPPTRHPFLPVPTRPQVPDLTQ